MGRAKQYCLFLSVLVIYVCLKREKNLTLQACAPDFSVCSMTNYTQKSRARTQCHSLTFLKLGRYAFNMSVTSMKKFLSDFLETDMEKLILQTCHLVLARAFTKFLKWL